MKNLATLLLFLAASGLAVVAYRQDTTLREQAQAIQRLTAKLDDTSRSATLARREKCARQADEVFKSGGWDKQALAGYINHFNDALNKCFILINSTTSDEKSPGVVFRNSGVSDAFEGTDYAQYIWRSEAGKKYWEVKPFLCSVITQAGDTKHCASEDEYNELIKYYMGADPHL
jgi:hypothetical protein